MSLKRTVCFFCFILFCFSALIFRIYDISQNKTSVYTAKTSNSYRVVIDKSRGMIYDRNLNPLVSSEKVYKVAVLPSIKSKSYLYSVLDRDEFLKLQDDFSLGKPFTFETEKYIPESDDVKVFLAKKRYSDNPLAVHFIGYCNKALSSGVTGIEKAYDELLSSQTASLSLGYPIDAAGRALNGIEPTVYSDGYDSKSGVALTLDAEIQKIAQDAAGHLKGNGSILVTDVNTGEILAGVSTPEYNRSDIASSINLNNSALLNRNLCAYNIGSTYKIIVSAAALSNGLSSNFSHNCNGSLTVDRVSFSCHKKEGHGYLSLNSAFANSCNPYFIKMGLSVGKERLLSFSSLFGLGKPIVLCDGIKTASGCLPNSDSIVSNADLANISFGQGELMATPVHIAKIISIVANGGYLVEPSLVLGEVNSQKEIKLSQKTDERSRVISADVAKKLREYMIYTVTSGTGRAAQPQNLKAGGKTASAETGWKIDGENIVQAWFSGFYPADKPKYAIVVLCEAGGSGAQSCAPVFKKICDGLYSNGFVK